MRICVYIYMAGWMGGWVGGLVGKCLFVFEICLRTGGLCSTLNVGRIREGIWAKTVWKGRGKGKGAARGYLFGVIYVYIYVYCHRFNHLLIPLYRHKYIIHKPV